MGLSFLLFFVFGVAVTVFSMVMSVLRGRFQQGVGITFGGFCDW